MQINFGGLDIVMSQMVLDVGDGMATVVHVNGPAVTKAMDGIDVFKPLWRKGLFRVFLRAAFYLTAVRIRTSVSNSFGKKSLSFMWKIISHFYHLSMSLNNSDLRSVEMYRRFPRHIPAICWASFGPILPIAVVSIDNKLILFTSKNTLSSFLLSLLSSHVELIVISYTVFELVFELVFENPTGFKLVQSFRKIHRDELLAISAYYQTSKFFWIRLIRPNNFIKFRPTFASSETSNPKSHNALIKSLREGFGNGIQILAFGTNSIATSRMMKMGANRGATGENAIVRTSAEVDIIISPLAMIVANSMMRELTSKMAEAIGSSRAMRILIPLTQENTVIAGVRKQPLPHLVDQVVGMIKEMNDNV